MVGVWGFKFKGWTPPALAVNWPFEGHVCASNDQDWGGGWTWSSIRRSWLHAATDVGGAFKVTGEGAQSRFWRTAARPKSFPAWRLQSLPRRRRQTRPERQSLPGSRRAPWRIHLGSFWTGPLPPWWQLERTQNSWLGQTFVWKIYIIFSSFVTTFPVVFKQLLFCF